MVMHVQEWRDWLRAHPVFPLLLTCAGSAFLSGLLLIMRKVMTGQGRLSFLPFNLVLAFLPLAFLLLFERARKRSHAVVCAGLWLLFFPNAPYMLTDLVHFDRGLGPASWLDLMALLAAAWSALLGGMITLRFMQDRVQRHHRRTAGHGFVLTVLFLTGMGIYVGRFLRFHSFHIVSQPMALVSETASHFFNPAVDPMAWPFTLSVFALLCCIYYSLLAFTHAVRTTPRTPAPE
jgi:uncharacterized membrane protein